MLGYLSADIICSEKRTLFRKRSSRKTELWGTDNVQGQICQYISMPNGGLCLLSFKYFFATRAGLQFVEYFSWGIFGRVTRLDQSRGRENIWWITSSDILHPFRKANNFLRAKFEEYCELFGRDNVKGQISEHTFPPNGSYLLYHPSNTFRNMHGLENWRICISYNPPINFRVILLATLRHVV